VVHLIRFLSRSPDQTFELGRKLGLAVSPGDVIALTGDLGAGKSVFARGVLDSLGVEGDMPSPSFVIAATYRGSMPVNHIDLYRLKTEAEAVESGLEELLYSDGVCVVEWADRLEGLLPASRIDVELRAAGKVDHRLISITTGDPDVRSRLTRLANALMRLADR
jgi:tRNA threonylcarbamoyladenosine biosynthesis protein TsaE